MRHLVPLAEVIEGLKGGTPIRRSGDSDSAGRDPLGGVPAPAMRSRPSPKSQVKASPRRVVQTKAAPSPVKVKLPATGRAEGAPSSGGEGDLKSACLAELQRTKKVLYGTVI
ncbi:MAG TPA: hypothetical protein EYM91_03305, partial [Acidobacteria bacterium]|nr:hypothetical protein [Acidobacteriota bacterium]